MEKMEAICVTEEDRILDRLNSQGIVKFKNILSETDINSMRNDAFRLLSPSSKDPRNFIIQTQQANFIAHTMFVKNAIKAYTNIHVLNIAERFSLSKVHLSNHRIFQNVTTKKEPQHWHKDNEIDFMENDELVIKMEIDNKGLVMLYYLEDVKEGGTEFILGNGPRTF